ncbi:MAG: transporter substrate-binding domain-containing protein [Pseudonocardiaceae bacterium]
MDLEAQELPPERSPAPSRSPGSRVSSALGVMRRHGWLRPRRIGCLLVVLVIAAIWLVGRVVDEVNSLFSPPPVAGNPLSPVVPARPASSGSPTIDRITQRSKLIIAVQEAPGLVQRSSGPGGYTGFDIALLDLIARDLAVNPARTSFKPLPAGTREAALERGDVDLLLGGYEITTAPTATVGIAGPYLVLGSTEYGIGLPPGDPVLHDRITAALRHAIDDGTWARLYAQYLGSPVPSPPVLR